MRTNIEVELFWVKGKIDTMGQGALREIFFILLINRYRSHKSGSISIQFTLNHIVTFYLPFYTTNRQKSLNIELFRAFVNTY